VLVLILSKFFVSLGRPKEHRFIRVFFELCVGLLCDVSLQHQLVKRRGREEEPQTTLFFCMIAKVHQWDHSDLIRHVIVSEAARGQIHECPFKVLHEVFN